MKKILIIFLLVSVMGCSPGPENSTTDSSGDDQATNLAPEQTAISPTLTSTPEPTLTTTIALTAIGGGAGRIAFTSERDGYPEIYVIITDGSGLVKLANNITPKSDPAWSPDGSKIAFGFSSDDSASLYVMNADGSDPTKLIDTKGFSSYSQLTPDWRSFSISYPTWSPDGSKIAFRYSYYVNCCSGRSTINVINVDGSNLVSVKGFGYDNSTVAWSFDSQKIAFVSESCGGRWDICVMNADGANLINLTNNVVGDWEPRWSPDGKKIVFSSSRNLNYGNYNMYVMNADGTDPINLTPRLRGWGGDPQWSPDGRKIVFVSPDDGDDEIYLMNSDGTDLINLTNNQAVDSNPIWSPDGSKIAFESDRDGNLEIYVVNADGSGLIRLTNNDANDYSPVWSP